MTNEYIEWNHNTIQAQPGLNCNLVGVEAVMKPHIAPHHTIIRMHNLNNNMKIYDIFGYKLKWTNYL